MFKNIMKFLSVDTFNEFLEIIKACGVEYKVENMSDYTGFEALIMWND